MTMKVILPRHGLAREREREREREGVGSVAPFYLDFRASAGSYMVL